MTLWRHPFSFVRPSTATVAVPAPVTLAPRRSRKRPRSPISGSLAAFLMTVRPGVAAAAIMRFWVAPTLGKRSLNATAASRGALMMMSP